MDFVETTITEHVFNQGWVKGEAEGEKKGVKKGVKPDGRLVKARYLLTGLVFCCVPA